MRHPLTLLALLVLVSAADAQRPLTSPAKGPPIDLVAAPPQRPFFGGPWIRPPLWGGYWGGFYSDFYYPGLFQQQPQVVIVPQPMVAAPAANPARLAEDADRAAATAPAVLTLELPAAADVWLDGEQQPSSADTTRTLTSPPLAIGREHTFRVRARWTEGGTTYEAEKASVVRAGERGKVAIYAGTAVK
jgi:uncharacterized protein (TIGR03000 family)